jgi:hypothetical protein
LNASGVAVNPTTTGFFVNPVRSNAGTFSLTYNTTSGEISYAVAGFTGINSSGNIGINASSNTSNALYVNGTQSNTGALFIGDSINLTTPGAAIMNLVNSANTNQLTIVGGVTTATNYSIQSLPGDSVIRTESSAGLCLTTGSGGYGGLRIAPTTAIITTTSNIVSAGSVIASNGFYVGTYTGYSNVLGNTLGRIQGLYNTSSPYDSSQYITANWNPSNNAIDSVAYGTCGVILNTNQTTFSYISFLTSAAANVVPTERLRVTSAGATITGALDVTNLNVSGNIRTSETLYIANLIRFRGTTGDGVLENSHTIIGERIYEDTENSELLLFKGNDTNDRVRTMTTGGFQVDICPENSVWSVGGNPPSASITGALTVNTNGRVGINSTTPSYTLDVNGPAQSAVYYSSITAGGTTTVTPNNFGIFYNIMTSGTYTLAFSATQAASNIGKYVCFRNNSGTTLSLILTGVSGITSPVSLANAQSATFVVATTTTYALF